MIETEDLELPDTQLTSLRSKCEAALGLVNEAKARRLGQ